MKFSFPLCFFNFLLCLAPTLALEESLHDHLRGRRLADLSEVVRVDVPADDAEIYYFGYGANMMPLPGTITMERATLLEHYFDFSVVGTLLPFEPHFANVIPATDHDVEGVLHLMKAKDVVAIDDREGPAYSRLTSTVVRAEGEEVQAHYYTQLKAYESAPLNPGEPGERYHKLLLAGARGSNLPHPWIDNIISFGYVPFPVLNITDAQQAMIDAQVWTPSELEEQRQNGSKLFSVDGVVLEVVEGEQVSHLWSYIIATREGGNSDIALQLAAFVKYDPLPESLKGLSADQHSFIEACMDAFINDFKWGIKGSCEECKGSP